MKGYEGFFPFIALNAGNIFYYCENYSLPFILHKSFIKRGEKSPLKNPSLWPVNSYSSSRERWTCSPLFSPRERDGIDGIIDVLTKGRKS